MAMDNVFYIHLYNYFSWSYTREAYLDGVSKTGQLATYGGGGAVQDLSSVKNTSRLILQELKEGLWLTRGTRLVSIDFSVYNANINLFCLIK